MRGNMVRSAGVSYLWRSVSQQRRRTALVRVAAPLVWLGLLVAAAAGPVSASNVISNGGFDAGFTGWVLGTRPDRANGAVPYLANSPSGWVVSNQPVTDGVLSLDPISGNTAFAASFTTYAGIPPKAMIWHSRCF